MMVTGEERGPIAVSNTSPLISAFQSDRFDLIAALLGPVHTIPACVAELLEHGWGEVVKNCGSDLISHTLTASGTGLAEGLARRIAVHPTAKNPDPNHHLGEAEVIVLAQRSEFTGAVLLLDERAARSVATENGLDLSGFAGILLLAVEEGFLGAEDTQEKLERCRLQGTHYSAAFIAQIYQAAKEKEKENGK